MSAIADTIAHALRTPDALTSAHAGELKTQATRDYLAIEGRMRELQPDGQARLRVLQTGGVDDIAAQDAEFERLKIEYAQLGAQIAALGTIQQRAAAREASENLPAMLRDLADLLGAADSAETAYRAACDRAKRAFQAVSQSRGLAQAARLPFAFATVELAERVKHHVPEFARTPNHVADLIGVPDKSSAVAA